MKKILTILTTLVLFLGIICSNVYATTSFNVELKTNKTTSKNGDIVEITIGLKDFTNGEKGINVLALTLDYDTSVFEKISDKDITAVNGWGSPMFNVANGKLIADRADFVTKNHEAIKIKLKVRKDATSGDAAVKVKEITASDSTSDISSKEVSTTVKINSDNKGTTGTTGENQTTQNNVQNQNETNNALNENNSVEKDNLKNNNNIWIVIGIIIAAFLVVIGGSLAIVIKKNKKTK